MDVIKWTGAALLGATVYDTFELQGATRTVAVVRHGRLEIEMGGPIGPRTSSDNTTGHRKYSWGGDNSLWNGLGDDGRLSKKVSRERHTGLWGLTTTHPALGGDLKRSNHHRV
jgi:hypothetical protein